MASAADTIPFDVVRGGERRGARPVDGGGLRPAEVRAGGRPTSTIKAARVVLLSGVTVMVKATHVPGSLAAGSRTSGSIHAKRRRSC